MKTFSSLTAAAALTLSVFTHAQANTLTDEERSRAIDYLKKTQQEFIAALDGVSDEQWKFKPAPGRWSIAECAEHIAATEEMIWNMLREQVLKSPAAPEKAAARVNDDEMVQKIEGREQKVQAPELLRPTGRWSSRAEMVKHFTEAREAQIAFLRGTKEDLRSHFEEHPWFEELDAYQWMLLNGAHSRRHTSQIEEVKAAPGYPKS